MDSPYTLNLIRFYSHLYKVHSYTGYIHTYIGFIYTCATKLPHGGGANQLPICCLAPYDFM